MRVYTGNILESSPSRARRSAETQRALVGVHRAHADPVAIAAFAEYDAHPFAGFLCLLFAEFLDTFGHLFWVPDTEESLVPWARVERLIDVAPLTESRDGGGVDFFVELCAAVVFDTILDGSDDENEEEGKSCGRGRGGSKDGKDYNVLGSAGWWRQTRTLENDESKKVNVGYAVRRRQRGRARQDK